MARRIADGTQEATALITVLAANQAGFEQVGQDSHVTLMQIRQTAAVTAFNAHNRPFGRWSQALQSHIDVLTRIRWNIATVEIEDGTLWLRRNAVVHHIDARIVTLAQIKAVADQLNQSMINPDAQWASVPNQMTRVRALSTFETEDVGYFKAIIHALRAQYSV